MKELDDLIEPLRVIVCEPDYPSLLEVLTMISAELLAIQLDGPIERATVATSASGDSLTARDRLPGRVTSRQKIQAVRDELG